MEKNTSQFINLSECSQFHSWFQLIHATLKWFAFLLRKAYSEIVKYLLQLCKLWLWDFNDENFINVKVEICEMFGIPEVGERNVALISCAIYAKLGQRIFRWHLASFGMSKLSGDNILRVSSILCYTIWLTNVNS